MQPIQSNPARRAADGTAQTPPERLADLVHARVLDAELAALLWVMVGVRTPVVVIGEAGTGRTLVADALADCLPSTAVLLPVAADDTFTWLPQAVDLGWTADAPDQVAPVPVHADPSTGVLLARDLADPWAGGPAADRARLLVRALSLGYGMLATMPGRGLDDMLDRLHAPAVGTVEDERSRLGIVLVMAPRSGHRGPRVAVAHYVRPVALDTHGHVQRLPPIVLATWSEAGDRWDHFAWGALPDLAGRAGTTPRELEAEQARRAASLVSVAGR